MLREFVYSGFSGAIGALLIFIVDWIDKNRKFTYEINRDNYVYEIENYIAVRTQFINLMNLLDIYIATYEDDGKLIFQKMIFALNNISSSLIKVGDSTEQLNQKFKTKLNKLIDLDKSYQDIIANGGIFRDDNRLTKEDGSYLKNQQDILNKVNDIKELIQSCVVDIDNKIKEVKENISRNQEKYNNYHMIRYMKSISVGEWVIIAICLMILLLQFIKAT